MTAPRYLYHLVPPKVEGEFLMPLSGLRTHYPALHDQHLAKYIGREELIGRRIPVINCNWTEVLQLTPVHPEEIKQALLESGFGWRPMLFFEVDHEKAGMNGENTVIFRNLVKPPGDFAPAPDEFVAFSPGDFLNNSTLPQATHDHFREAKATSGRPLLFLWVPHVLFAGQIAVNNLKIVEI